MNYKNWTLKEKVHEVKRMYKEGQSGVFAACEMVGITLHDYYTYQNDYPHEFLFKHQRDEIEKAKRAPRPRVKLY
jgi:hypothetical protein